MALAKALMRTGKMAEAEQKYRSVVELYPDFGEGKYALGMLLVETGRLDKAEPWMNAVASGGEDPFVAFQTAWVYVNLGLLDDAHRVTAAIKGSPGHELGVAGEFAVRNDWRGMIAYGRAMQARSRDAFWPTVIFQGQYMTGQYDAALATLRAMRPDLVSPDAQVSVLELDLDLAAAHLLRLEGDEAQASRLLERTLAATTPQAGQRSPNDWRLARVRVYAERGETAQALAELEGAVKAGWRTPFLADSVWLEQQPMLAGLRDHPRFKALLAQVRRDLATQKAAVLATRG
jgi:tetratricopeptide (TPR) repeat protein